MTISAIYFLNSHHRVILSRDYRGEFLSCCHDQRKPCAECDPVEIFISDHSRSDTPLFYSKEIDKTIAHIYRSGIYVMSPLSGDGDVSSVFVFLHRLVDVMQHYFGVFTEESLKDNFTVVYEILDETIDFGYIQTTDEKCLQEYVLQRGFEFFPSKTAPAPQNGAVSWRREDVFYSKNEVYLDVVESISATFDEEGKTILSEIAGCVLVNCRLSGMPVVSIGLNDRLMLSAMQESGIDQQEVELENISFHPCVDLSQFEANRTISFIPPDGEFELFSYVFLEDVSPPLFVGCEIEEYSGTRIVYSIKTGTKLPRDSPIIDVSISVPVPEDADSPVFKTKHGRAKYIPEENVFVWKIKTIPFGKQIQLSAQIGLPRIRTISAKPKTPILVRFRVPYFCSSGLQIKYLRVSERSGYQAMTWVRYLTKEGVYSSWIEEVV